MTTPLNKLAESWRDGFVYGDAWDCADELEAALTAHNQRWLDLADELDAEAFKLNIGRYESSDEATGKEDAAQRIRQLVKELGSA